MRYFVIAVVIIGAVLGVGVLDSDMRGHVRAIVYPEVPPITPLAVSTPIRVPSATVLPAPPLVSATSLQPTATAISRSLDPTPTRSLPTSIPTVAPVLVNGRMYDAYIPAAVKDKQAYKYSCEFDAAWVILATNGINVDVDDLIPLVGIDRGREPSIGEKTPDGHIIYGGDITAGFSGNYQKNFLARSTGEALRKVFEHYSLSVTPVHDRAGVETALRNGALVWMKTTVDFKGWRPAIWQFPDGRKRRTVLGNDHAVVVMGFNATGVVIRDVLGPTSSNRQRPYEYEVDWETFLVCWGAQEFDGLAVAPLP